MLSNVVLKLSTTFDVVHTLPCNVATYKSCEKCTYHVTAVGMLVCEQTSG